MEKIISAKTVDEAVEEGLQFFGKNKDEVEWEVLNEESKGFLGLIGKKDATVRMWEKETVNHTDNNAEEINKETEDIFEDEAVEVKAEKNIEKHNTDVLEKKAATAKEFLNHITELMGLNANICTELRDFGIFINIKDIPEEEKGIVIGRRAQTLDAIQYITSLVLNKSDDYVKIFMDVEGYRSEREEILKNLARERAKFALKRKKPVRLEPMNPYERRIIHSELQNFEGIYTYSQGNDPYRYVVICKK